MIDRRNGGVDLEGVLVRAGEIALARDGSRLVTVVGAGVAVCLWAPSANVAAVAHFVEPRIDDPERSFARYGNVAVPEVVRMVREEDPSGFVEAQLFGGATEYPGDVRGERNLSMAEKVLRKRSIEISSRDVGGSKGRKVVFDGRTGQVAVVKVHQLRKEDWAS